MFTRFSGKANYGKEYIAFSTGFGLVCKMNRLLYAGLLVSVLVVSVWVTTSLNIANQPAVAEERQTYDVRVLVHLNDAINTTMVKDMLSELPQVTGLQFDVWVGDNTTGGIVDAKARIDRWLSEFTRYNIVIQCDYFFEQKYGYFENPFWKFNHTQTLSQQWYNDWYGNLSEVLNKYPNVQLMVGTNEPYNHFTTKEMAQTIMKREYLTWKNMSSIPFTVKFSMPYLMWAEHWDFPKNASIEADYLPIWKDYSDYVGMDLWADSSPPQYGTNVEVLAHNRVVEAISIAENYSALLKKPIFIGEYPAWAPNTLEYICDHIAKPPHIGQIYQLWYWSGQEDLHQDAWTYGLFNVDPVTFYVTRAEPSYSVFKIVFDRPAG